MDISSFTQLREKILDIKISHPTMFIVWDNYLKGKIDQQLQIKKQIDLLIENTKNNAITDMPIESFILLLSMQNI